MLKQISPVCQLYLATLVLLLAAQPAMTEENKSVVLELDHVSVCGSNLDTLRQDFTAVGLTPDEGGPHGNGITQMALVGFDDGTYIELIAPIKPGVTTGSDWSKFMSDAAVTCAWAVETNVLLQEVDRLKKAGITVTAAEPGSRKRPDGMSLEWMTASDSERRAAGRLRALPAHALVRPPLLWRQFVIGLIGGLACAGAAGGWA